MRHDLCHWEQALILANSFAKEEIAGIARDYGHELEMDGKSNFSAYRFKGKYSEALSIYEMGVSNLNLCKLSESAYLALKKSIVGGLARTFLRLGDISKGMRLLANSTDKNLLQDCSNILEGLKQYEDAAGLLERTGKWNNAAQLWIKCAFVH